MSNPKKTYFLVPDFHLAPPPNGPLSLGSIITSPGTPERILNKANRVYVPATSIYASHQSEWSSTRCALIETTVGVWTNFLQLALGISADVKIQRSQSAREVYRCKDLETTYFQPDEEYILSSLKLPMVKSYMEKSWWRSPVYLVTGLKIARGMSAESEDERGYSGMLKAGVAATLLTGGVPISGDPKVEGKLEKKEGVSWASSEDFVFGYRLVRIKLRGKSGDFREADYNKGALYDVGDGSADEENSSHCWIIEEVTGTADDAKDLPTAFELE